MKKLIALVFTLVVQSSDAEACHHFSKWYYHYPQRCRLSDVRPHVRIVYPPLPKHKISTIPEFVAPPIEDWDNIMHKDAMIKLRLEMQGKWKDK